MTGYIMRKSSGHVSGTTSKGVGGRSSCIGGDGGRCGIADGGGRISLFILASSSSTYFLASSSSSSLVSSSSELMSSSLPCSSSSSSSD